MDPEAASRPDDPNNLRDNSNPRGRLKSDCGQIKSATGFPPIHNAGNSSASRPSSHNFGSSTDHDRPPTQTDETIVCYHEQTKPNRNQHKHRRFNQGVLRHHMAETSLLRSQTTSEFSVGYFWKRWKQSNNRRRGPMQRRYSHCHPS